MLELILVPGLLIKKVGSVGKGWLEVRLFAVFLEVVAAKVAVVEKIAFNSGIFPDQTTLCPWDCRQKYCKKEVDR